MKKYNTIVTPIIVSLIVSGVMIGVYNKSQKSESEYREHYYNSEVATLESPHGIRKKIMSGNEDFILIDVRSAQEYEEEHIVGAYNVPIYTNPDTSAYDEVDRVVTAFEELQEAYPFRKLIIYCYSSSCMSGRKVGKILAEHGIYAKEMGVGWNEWRYDWNMWNYPHEWETTDVMDYVIPGIEPGEYMGPGSGEPKGCDASDAFSC